MSTLLHNLTCFSRVLHVAGLDVHAARMPEIVAALAHVNVGRRSDFYFTLRTLLVHRPQDLGPFDEAFRIFWQSPSSGLSSMDLHAIGERRRYGRPQVEFSTGASAFEERNGVPTLHHSAPRVIPESYSTREVSRTKDFGEFTEEELNDARAMIEALEWKPGMRHTRRWTAESGTAPDWRSVIRRNMRYGGEVFEIPARRRKQKPRDLVVLCDVSGSMERYSRMLLHFMHTLAGRVGRLEAFVFSTRLNRITRELENERVGDALLKVSKQVSGFAGGTRIGDALREFNLMWARRTLAHGAVVLLISDGWDRGDPRLLAAEVSRLRRTCRRLIWLNPLLGSPAYRPLTRGMSAALPFIDDFLPVHNLDSLEALAFHLNSLPNRRGTVTAARS